MSERLDMWMDGYVAAWSSNEEEQIAALFSSDAVYDPQTADGEKNGIAEIVHWWQETDDEEDNWDFEWLPLVENEELAVVTGSVRYFEPPMSYRVLWIIRFDQDDKCYDFTEWYIEEDDV